MILSVHNIYEEKREYDMILSLLGVSSWWIGFTQLMKEGMNQLPRGRVNDLVWGLCVMSAVRTGK